MTGTADGRKARGDATRHRVARVAADIATVDGLDSITIGRLAEHCGMSKSGILTVFGTRETIQVAAVAGAREVYREKVIAPVWGRVPGLPRLRGLVDSWIDYLRAEVFPGGCFIAKTSVEYGHRDGPVADAVRKLKLEWLDLLETELLEAGSIDPGTDAFLLDAVLTAANSRRELFGDDRELDRARRVVNGLLDGVGRDESSPSG